MINRLLLFICISMLSTLSYASAAPTSSAAENPTSKITQEMSGAQPILSKKDISQVDKYVWMARMKKTLPDSLCDKSHYFLKCFNTDEKECQKLTSIFLGACLDKAITKLPSQLTSNQQAEWGQIMGRCTYDLYNTFMADLKKSEPACAIKPQNSDDALKSKPDVK